MRHTKVLLTTAICAVICASAAGCRRSGAVDHASTNSAIILHDVCILVALCQVKTQEPPPTKLYELVEWLEKYGLREEYVDYENKTIRDVWGNDVIVVSKEGQFIGVGSAGRDGVWEGGTKGDDIVATLKDVFKR